jgi:hypothetical protein
VITQATMLRATMAMTKAGLPKFIQKFPLRSV